MLMVNTQAVHGNETRAQGGCGCGGHEKSGGGRGCGGQEQSGCGCGSSEVQHSGIDLGQRYSLNSAAGESTATDPIPLGGATAIQVCVTIMNQAGAANLTIAPIGTSDDDNYFSIMTQVISGGVGYYTFSVTGLAWDNIKLGVLANAGTVPIVFSLYVNLTCA